MSAGMSAGMLFLAPSALTSCGKSWTDTPTTKPGGSGGAVAVDFTLDLTSPTYSVLNNNGGSIVKDNIIIARTSAGAFVALTGTSLRVYEWISMHFSRTSSTYAEQHK